jgi:TonB family protein
MISFLVSVFWLSSPSTDYEPARREAGAVPAQPREALGGGQTILELSVSASGEVAESRVLRDTPPFTEFVQHAVRGWTFRPARERKENELVPTASRVLVTAVFRAPALEGPTLGEIPRAVGTPSDAIPFPTRIVTPPYPPRSLAEGVVLAEVVVDTQGTVSAARIVQSVPGLDEVSMEAAKGFRFRPARREGGLSGGVVYLLFGFRQPMTSP